MGILIKQFSSLKKICRSQDMQGESVKKATILKGECFSYQIAIFDEDGNLESPGALKVDIESDISDYVKVYNVRDVVADFPKNERADDNYIADAPCLIPDLLVPIDEQNGYINFQNYLAVLWVEVCIPNTTDVRDATINFSFTGRKVDALTNTFRKHYVVETAMNLNVLAKELPKQKLLYTQWFYNDCIASVHNVEIYGEKHWELIDKYMAMASKLGVNMLLTPVLSPALDTAPGICRPDTQLVKIAKNGEKYTFDFSLLHRYVEMAKKNNIKHFEISHFFTQWGCRFTPNIYAIENGEKKHIFGWHVPANSPLYSEFLNQFIPALLKNLSDENILDKCYFHLSDEPSNEHLQHYEYASRLLKPLLGECKIMDALSHTDFYKKGLVNCPVCATDYIQPFIDENVEHLWAYYCCSQVIDVSNRFMAMPSYRNRIIGVQLYKYDIEGFLHWGYNFYYSQYSLYTINPYVTTSANTAFTSGDPFSVYPGENGPLPSIRALVFREALQDIEIFRLLEQKIGRDNVIKMIEEEAGMEITFKEYPKNADFIENLIEKIKNIL